MMPSVPATPATITTIPQLNSPPPIAQSATPTGKELTTSPHSNKFNQVSLANWTKQTPLASPDLNSVPAPKLIAQELPGSSAPPPPKTIRDTGSGYPTRIPANYFGPAVSFGNNTTSFGVVSRFPIGDKYSIRPSATFGSKGTTLRVPLTYDFGLGDPEPFEANPVVTFHGGGGVEFSSGGGTVEGDKFSLLGTVGIDANLFEGVALLADFNTNFGSNNSVTLGFGFEF